MTEKPNVLEVGALKKILSEPLDHEELEQLGDFLLYRIDDDTAERIAAAGGDEGILDVSELDGFLTAVVSGPDVIAPSQWIPAMWGAAEPSWESRAQFETIFGLIVRHQNSIVATLMHDPQAFEPMFEERVVEGTTHLIVDEWCFGYLSGVALDAEAWAASEADIKGLLRPIRLWGTEAGWKISDAMSDAEKAREKNSIPECVRALHKYWLDRRGLQSAPFRRASPKTGRNDPCTCGSGRKYKQCCLQ